MRYTDYERIKIGGFCSVGKFGEKIYAFEILTGIANAPEYHRISREEFDCFDDWKNTEPCISGFVCGFLYLEKEENYKWEF